MKSDRQLVILLALKRAETIYFNGGDWKGFVLKLAEIEKGLEKGQFKETFFSEDISFQQFK